MKNEYFFLKYTNNKSCTIHAVIAMVSLDAASEQHTAKAEDQTTRKPAENAEPVNFLGIFWRLYKKSISKLKTFY